MTQRVTRPIALDRSFNTTESTPRNIADVLAENLLAIKEAIENGADTGGAFIVSYGSTTAQQIYDAIRENKVPYLYYNGVVAQLWKVETNKYTFRTTETRVVDSQTYLDIIDYSVTGVTWDTDTKTISGGGDGQTPYFAKASSVSPFDTTGKSGSQEVVYIDDVPEDGIYQVSVLMGITPQIAAASKSDLVFKIVSAGSDRMNNSFHAIVDDSELFAQQVSFSLSLTLKAGRNSFVLECDSLTTSYLVSVDIMTIASLVNGNCSGGGTQEQADWNESDIQSPSYIKNKPAIPVVKTLVAGQNVTLEEDQDSITINATGGGGGTGTSIYPSLQDAITDASNLAVGEYFETNGFYTSGDGGAARYLVSSSGTANGMDIVQLATGKLAVVQLKGSAYTEQIGYVVNSSQADVGPYIKRLLAMGIQTVKFYPTGSAPTACYCIRDMLDLDRSDYHNVGIKLEGADIGQTSGYATWFNFQPSVSNTDKIAIKIHARTTRIENIALIYGAGASDTNVRGTSAAICFDSTGNSSYQTSSYGTVLRNLTIQGFNTAILSTGASPYIWHVDCEKITCSANNTHVSLDGLSYCTTFRNCLFNSPDVQSVYLGEPFTVKFDSCNFGIDDRGTCIVRAVKWVVSSALVDEKRGICLFQNCNMEVEYRGSSVPQNNKHLFIYADDNSLIDYEFDNCCFIYTPLTRENVTDDRMMSLGAGSSIIIRNSTGPYADVNYTGNEFYGKDYDKYFFDESRPPEKKIGSLKLEHTIGVDPLPFLDSAHLPCLVKDSGAILYDNTTNLNEFKGLDDGTILLNLDTAIPSVKVAGKLQACASAPTGVVRIGNELYDYVVIDGRKWITRNLNLRIATRQHTIWDHLEWGQYYKYSDLSAIAAKLPSGWRIPNASDVSSLIGDGSSTRAHNLQSTGVSYWTNATNSTGFSALPSTWWYKPNTTPHATFKQYAFYWTSVTEGTNVKNISIAPNAVSSGGWTSSEAANLWIPLRVCSDE